MAPPYAGALPCSGSLLERSGAAAVEGMIVVPELPGAPSFNSDRWALASLWECSMRWLPAAA